MHSKIAEALLEVQDELARIGIEDCGVEIIQLSRDAVLVEVFSDVFEGQSFLDAELLVRPAVLRAFGNIALRFSTITITTRTRAVGTDFETSEDASEHDSVSEEPEERLNRAAIRKEIDCLLRVLRDSGYSVSKNTSSVYVAEKGGLVHEIIALGFHTSPRTTTIDRDVRAEFTRIRNASGNCSVFYLSVSVLLEPFANQKKAEWISCLTFREFLHRLNRSDAIAEKTLNELTREGQASRLQGSLVEPIGRWRSYVASRDVAETSSEGLVGHDTSAYERILEWAVDPRSPFLLLMSPAGHGKTTCAKEIARRLAERRREADDRTPIPLLVGFADVRRVVDFEALVYKALSRYDGPSFAAFSELLARGEAVLIVDGFDELASDAGLSVAEHQVRSMSQFVTPDAKVVLAGRSLFVDTLSRGDSVPQHFSALLGGANVATLELLPFDSRRVEEYVELYSSRNLDFALEDFRTALKNSPDLASMCSHPLLLAMLCEAWNGIAGSGESRADLAPSLESIIISICKREQQRQHLTMAAEDQLAFLRDCAGEVFRKFVRNGTPSLTHDELQSLAELRDGSLSTAAQDNLAQLANHALFIAGTGRSLRFIHPWLRDVLLGQAVLAGDRDILVQGDLPEAAVRVVAKGVLELEPEKTEIFGENWLGNSLPAMRYQRRNLVRVAIQRAHMRASGDPRDWLEDSWVRKDSISSLDFGQMVVLGSLIQEVRFVECSFEGAYFGDSGFVGVSFERCSFDGLTLMSTHFDECEFVNCEHGTLYMRGGGGEIRVFDSRTFLKASSDEIDTGFHRGGAKESIEFVTGTFALVLRKATDSQNRFISKSRDTLEREVYTSLFDETKRRVASKYLLPLLFRQFFTTHVQSAKELITVSSEWQDRLSRWLDTSTDNPPEAVREALEPIAVRVSAHLSRRA